MSLILEALRKSEAERRRGLAPDLHAELPPVPARHVPARAVWWAAAIALLLAFAVWLALREPAQPTAAVQQPAASAMQPRPEPQPLPARTPPATAQAQRPAAAPAPKPTTETQPTTREAPARLPADTSASEVPAPDAPAADIVAATPDAATRPTSSSAAPADVPASVASTGDGRVLSLAELDSGTRNALPPLKLSMHLWNRDPAQRFVILDGQRLGEGDRIGEARIVRIERDGVLLDWHGRGVRVPVR